MLIWKKLSTASLEEGKKYWVAKFYSDTRPFKKCVYVDGKLETIIQQRNEPETYICCIDEMKLED